MSTPTITIATSVKDLAEAFANLDDREMCNFFNHVAAVVAVHYPQGEFGFSMQMEYVRGSMREDDSAPRLNSKGMAIMKYIGGDY